MPTQQRHRRQSSNLNGRRVKPVIQDSDRFSMTFILAAIFHGMVILGVTFSFSSPADSKTPPALDIILVQTRAPANTDDEADYLAQVSQQGGGAEQEKSRPRELFSAPTLSQQPGLSRQTQVEQQRQQQRSEQLALLSQDHASYSIRTDNTAEQDSKQQHQQEESRHTRAARLAAEISHVIEQQASRDRTRYLNSSTREFTAAKYMRDWIDRVERIGNLNYPDQARRQKLSGTLILDVVIDAEGKLLRTDLRHSSGHQVLDDAALRIVKLAAPFPPFPEKLRAETDIIHITRSWEFLSNDSSLRAH